MMRRCLWTVPHDAIHRPRPTARAQRRQRLADVELTDEEYKADLLQRCEKDPEKLTAKMVAQAAAEAHAATDAPGVVELLVALFEGGPGDGASRSRVVVRLEGLEDAVAPDAKADDIAQLLNNYSASIVSGPKSGMFRVRFGDKALSKDDAAKLMTRLQGEKIISLVVSAD